MRESRLLRTATLEDAPALAGLINDAFAVERFFKVGDRTSPSAVSELMATGDFLVLDGDDGAPVACVYVKCNGQRGYFGMLSVDPRMQGRGIARRVIAEVEDRCRRAGCQAMDIYVVNLRTELPGLYCKLGYAESGMLPFPHPAEATRPCHIIVMTKPLIDEAIRA